MTIAKMAPHHPTQRAYEEGQGEYRERRQQAAGLVGLRKEGGGDDGRQVAVGRVIEPFDEVAHETGPGGLAQGLAFGALDGTGEGGSIQGGAGHDKYPLVLLIGGRV
ncbi:hypothetical protein D3C81_1167790 [compost metagenome]